MYTQPIAYHATNTPERVAIEAPSGNVTYRRFEDDINKFANALRERLPSGGIAGVDHEDYYTGWLIIFALARLGYCTLSIALKGKPSDINPGVSFVVGKADGGSLSGVENIRFSTSEANDILAQGDATPVAGRAMPEDDARISLSSGTTGQQKRVMMSHATIVSRMKSGIFGSAMRADQRVYCQLPINTFGGFGVPVRTWYMGGSILFSKPSFATLDRERPLTIVTTPADLHAAVVQIPPDHAPFENLTMVVGGAAVPAEVARHARARLTRNIVLTYGSTETTTVAMASIDQKDQHPDLTGFVLPWIRVEIVSEDGKPSPIGSTGEVRIQCEGMVSSYLEDAAATEKAFRDGWFYPGDRGRLDAHRGLYISGRSDSTININGHKISAEQMEAVVARLPGVADVAVTTSAVTFGSLTAVILVVKEDGYSEKRVREAVEKEFKLRNFAVQAARKIPRNDLGKVERHKLPLLIDPRRLPSAKVPAYNRLRKGR